ncbi:uncharacterized protein LOC131955256 [Physella acuta]|uniref:uncharacterized protein LOC131955256 n=1 Tax=Physella acuta TaxID=109671 RepID=UPI0027DC0290|nr:uncharacterized protein LOC131955256 [Physella acuta]XP_059175278.1 uncharacterized protein LOC131955256 [Physella acuta]
MSRILGAPTVGPQQQVIEPEAKDPFEVITDEDLYKADEILTKEILWYAGYTLLSVVVFLVLVACLALDPRAFIIAFGTGSPCCLLCPCIKSLYKYTDPAKLIQASANKYVPGILIEDDGTIKQYDPSPDEMEALFELVNEFMTIS